MNNSLNYELCTNLYHLGSITTLGDLFRSESILLVTGRSTISAIKFLAALCGSVTMRQGLRASSEPIYPHCPDHMYSFYHIYSAGLDYLWALSSPEASALSLLRGIRLGRCIATHQTDT